MSTVHHQPSVNDFTTVSGVSSASSTETSRSTLPDLHDTDPQYRSPSARFPYRLIRTIFRFILNVFFRRIDVLNPQLFPSSGPVILVGNHANQFIDAMMLVSNSSRPISFMIAKKSYDRAYIGDVAKALCAVPVQRPQDIAVKGEGKIVSIEFLKDGSAVAIGEGTSFLSKGVNGTPLDKGCKLLGSWEGDLMVSGVAESDTRLPLKKPLAPLNYEFTAEGSAYKLLPKIDQSAVFEQVYDLLGDNGTVGIFPEGGSHDQGHLIPLKAGVTIMALGAAAKGTPVK
jgi:glycerol-3-phosphate O-acyltransferase/dihydroxyacetone phosphate acyltransferase